MTPASTSRVSVIIPCYNAERFIGDAIESALRQTHPDVEVIVVNDGSTDNSLEIVRGFGDRIRVHDGPNRGVCSARNTGFDLAQGDWIHYLDADDIIHPRKIAGSLKVHAAFPDTVFVWAPLRHVESAFRWMSGHCGPDGCTESFAGERATNALHAAHAPLCALFQKTFLGDVGPWDTSLTRWTDLEYHARIAALRPSYVALTEPLYFYREHDGPRISAANASFARLEDGRRALERARVALEVVAADTDECAHYLAPFYLNLARSAAANGKSRAFRELLSEADRLRAEPSFHWKCQLALICAALVGPKMTSTLIERALRL
jgi:glycosyltransferase involved in cell wall biosynthesis